MFFPATEMPIYNRTRGKRPHFGPPPIDTEAKKLGGQHGIFRPHDRFAARSSPRISATEDKYNCKVIFRGGGARTTVINASWSYQLFLAAGPQSLTGKVSWDSSRLPVNYQLGFSVSSERGEGQGPTKPSTV